MMADICFICGEAIYPDDESCSVASQFNQVAHIECAEEEYPEDSE
jgi:predicted nucleic acid-binding Zn ribbon protein